ncbi:MAG: hypothetical protein K8F91_24590 [Candidatus Obscuribacterales bacterium]|nr:hypothetical protein [Candidatus Obscuribacterales bacterium]
MKLEPTTQMPISSLRAQPKDMDRQITSSGIGASFERQRVGREEMFSEMYAVVRTMPEEQTSKMRLLKENFPSVFKLIEDHLDRFNADHA